MLKALKNALLSFLMLGAVCGVLYPVLVTVAAQYWFPEQANGSLVYRNGAAVGSALIAQDWSEARYFHGRPSASPGGANNAMVSGGSNEGPASVWLLEKVQERAADQRRDNPGEKGPVPQDLVTASGSGLDPHITVEAALWQVQRVARARRVPPAKIRRLVKDCTEKPLLHFLGEKRVNVLRINLELDRLYPAAEPARGKAARGRTKRGAARR